MLELREELQARFGGEVFEHIFALQGEEYRSLEGRRTIRCTFDGKGYFVKMHRGVGWREICKNLMQLKVPVLGAENEWRAIQRLGQLGVATMTVAGFGTRGWNPARRESFIVTEELENAVSLETFCARWPATPPPPALKRALITKVAEIAGCLHRNGVNHRDFYLCHFLLDCKNLEVRSADGMRLYLIDLHRMQIREKTPRRWILKDLAGLCFSSMDIGLGKRDLYRFMQIYSGKSLRHLLKEDGRMWRRVYANAKKLYNSHFSV